MHYKLSIKKKKKSWIIITSYFKNILSYYTIDFYNYDYIQTLIYY